MVAYVYICLFVWMYASIYVCMCACMCSRICACLWPNVVHALYMFLCVHYTSVCVYVCVYMHACMYSCMYARACIYACMCVMHVRVYECAVIMRDVIYGHA